MDRHAEQRYLELFERVPIRVRMQRIVDGLGRPRASGAHKLAVRELQHLVSWTAAVVVPVSAALLLALAFVRREHRATLTFRYLPEPEPVPDLDEPLPPPDIPEPVEPEFNEVFTRDALVTFADPSETPGAADSPQPKVGEFPPVPSIRILPGLTELRSGDGRDFAIETFGPETVKGTSECAVLRALRWLKQCQSPDGSWSLSSGGTGRGESARPAMTGLVLLTYLAHGETPDDRCEEFGETVRKAIEWLLANQEPDGRFRGRDRHDYSHPIATTALCEAYAMTHVPRVGDAAEKALAVILAGQHPEGGWDYNCRQSTRNDTSYMGWCAQALKAGHIAGLKSDGLSEAMQRAVSGFKRNAHPDGGFGYTGRGRGGLTAVGTLCMQLLGAPQDNDTRHGLLRLRRWSYDWAQPAGARPLYYWYYATYARFLDGGGDWKQWNGPFAGQLIRRQQVIAGDGDSRPDVGYWDSPAATENHGRVYSTALCTLMLEVYYKYQPSIQATLEERDAARQAGRAPGPVLAEIVLPDDA